MEPLSSRAPAAHEHNGKVFLLPNHSKPQPPTYIQGGLTSSCLALHPKMLADISPQCPAAASDPGSGGGALVDSRYAFRLLPHSVLKEMPVSFS